MAELHRHAPPAPRRHGFDDDNFIGATAQPNPWTDDGAAFFSEHRIGFQVRLARDRGLLSAAHAAQADRVRTRLPDLLAPCALEPPALLHGDLWSGNVHARQDGVVCLIDPAAHYGLREADLAMTRLFGSLPGEFYAAYDEAYPLPSGVAERVAVFNLYHLLNHLNLFGTGYLGQVLTILSRLS
jgi:fructosamine-3-kinase